MFGVTYFGALNPNAKAFSPQNKRQKVAMCDEAIDMWQELEERLRWSLRFKWVKDPPKFKDAAEIGKRLFVELNGRHPNYGGELYKYCNTLRKVYSEVDDWIPDAFQIWQEEEFDREVEEIMQKINAYEETKERARQHVDKIVPPGAPLLKAMEASKASREELEKAGFMLDGLYGDRPKLGEKKSKVEEIPRPTPLVRCRGGIGIDEIEKIQEEEIFGAQPQPETQDLIAGLMGEQFIPGLECKDDDSMCMNCGA